MIHIQDPQGILQNQVPQAAVPLVVVHVGVRSEPVALEKLELVWEVLEMGTQGVLGKAPDLVVVVAKSAAPV